jgi:hypothetical protein
MTVANNGSTLVTGDNDTIPVNIVDNTSIAGDIFFSKVIGVTSTVAVEATIDTKVFTASSSHGIIAGDQLVIFNGIANRLYIGCVIIGGVTGDVITMDTPFNYSYPIGAIVVRSTRDMIVDGSGTPEIFEIAGPIDFDLHVNNINISLFTEGATDLNKFGDRAELLNGLVLRLVNHTNVNYFNVKTNGQLSHMGKDVYTLIATQGWGTNGLGVNIQYAGEGGHGAVIKLSQGDKLQLIVQDDLTITAGGQEILKFEASIGWHQEVK